MSDFPSGKYRTIYIDPPWPERGGGKIKRGADKHYSLMSVAEIKALPVMQLAATDGCHLYCWATNNYLPAAIECVKAWGFEYVTTVTWMKNQQGNKKLNEKRYHPTQKPIALYKWIFKNYAYAGDRILDTHLGSGSSRIAAYDAGLDFVGCEIDPTYFKLQEERFNEYTAQQSLFVMEGRMNDEQI